MRQVHLDAIRTFEGFTERGVWDYKQVSNGYGTRARCAGEVIDRAEAERRFQAEVEEAHQAVARFAPSLDEGSTAALTSLTFNAGTSWMHSGLGAAVKAGDLDTARSIFKEYTFAGGRSLPGLAARRDAEVQWFGEQAPVGQAGKVAVADGATLASQVLEASGVDVASPRLQVSAPISTVKSMMPPLAAASHDVIKSLGPWDPGGSYDSVMNDLLAILVRLESPTSDSHTIFGPKPAAAPTIAAKEGSYSVVDAVEPIGMKPAQLRVA